MIKRVNFTGRRRIPRERVEIEIFDGSPRRFVAAIHLADLFPPDDPTTRDAAVFLEAMCAGSNVIERFSFGTIGNLGPRDECLLKSLRGENVFFTLKVVDRSQRVGRILGIAEGIRPQSAGKQTAAGRRGLLPIEPCDLGQELWQLDFKDQDVFLLVNREAPELTEGLRSDASLFAAIFPDVMRRILEQAFRENADIDEEDDRWPVLWLRFGRNLHPSRESPPTQAGQDEERKEWIDAVVRGFCETHRLKDKYLEKVRGLGGDDT